VQVDDGLEKPSGGYTCGCQAYSSAGGGCGASDLGSYTVQS